MDKIGWRKDFTAHKQSSYGGYCNLCRNNNLIPMPYHKFSDLLEQGMKTKEVFRKQLEEMKK